MTTTFASLSSLLDTMCRLVEEMSSGSLCSILLVDEAGERLRHGAGPSLPSSYTRAIDGSPIVPELGPCAKAAYLRSPVVVPDFETESPQFEFGALALAHGLRACWSTPILSSDGGLLGTFAIYSGTPRNPTEQDRRTIEQITHLLAIAIERKRTEEALRRSEEALRASEHLARGHLTALTHLLDSFARESDPDRLLEHVLRTIVEQSGAHSVSVWRRNDAGGWLDLVAVIEAGRYQTADDAVHPAARIPILSQDHPVWSEILRSGQHALLQDIDKESARMRVGSEPGAVWHRVLQDADSDPPRALLKEHLRRLGVVSILFVPMLVGGKVAGIIGIRFTLERAFRKEEIELTRALAHQAMLAMQLVRLSQQSRQAALEAERNRMARDIHDTLAQAFTGVIVQLEAAADANSKGLSKEAEQHLNRAGDLARESLKEARRSVRALRPQALEGKNLGEALDAMFRKMTGGTAVLAELSVQGAPQKLRPEWEENLLHVGQEVLTNALRHARATHFMARLMFDPQAIRMELHDNGRGFDADLKTDGIGLVGMKERVQSMGGELSIRSAPGAGTAISIVLPLTENAPLAP
jgi:signal transduction histidine kinase